MADAGECFDSVWPWALGGVLTGSSTTLFTAGTGAVVGGVVGAGGAYLTSTACGDGTNTPATLIRQGVTNFVKRLRGR